MFQQLILELISHSERFPLEKVFCDKIIWLIEDFGEFAFQNQNWVGHITASCLIMNQERTKVLLMMHKKLKKWLQFWGHSDGDIDTLATAIREFHEESGITIEPNIIPGIFNVDIHDIPEDIDNPKERVQCILEKKDALESGLIAPEHYANWALKILGSHATIEQFYHAWQQIFTVNEAMWRCVHQLANQEHSLILISNINAIHCPWIFSAYPEFSYFKHKILSYQIGILKPEPAIYRYAIDHFKLDPKSTLYIDDMPQNIASGREAGFQCWQYDTYLLTR